MVLKKPYAFLIKHFKLLHIIIAGLMIYLSIKINLITNLFDKLASGLSVSLSGLSDKYINILMFLAIIFILFGAFIVWFLMKNKEKPTKFYIAVMLYYIVLFIFLIIYNGVLTTLEEVSMTNQALRAYSDISLLLPLGQYYFIVIALLRGIGFNIKQFNFSKDIKELEISEEDSEEIEVNLSSNTYKYKRFGRRRLRELKYYFFENKYWILLILGIVFLGGLIYFFVNYKFVNNNYGQGASVKANYYNFSVNNTYITEKDLYGNVISEGKKYVIVDISIRNIYYESIPFEIKNFRLFIGDDFYYSISYKNDLFKDLGLPYDGKYLDVDNSYNYILIYELEENMKTNNMKLKVYNNMNYETAEVNYVNIKLKPIKLKDKLEEKVYSLNQEILLNENNYGNTTFNIKNYELVNNYEYEYEICVNKNCSKKTGVIVPNNVLKNKLISIDYALNIDENSKLNNYVKNDLIFFNTFVTLSYNLNGKVKTQSFVGISNSNIKNKIFMEASKDLDKASEIKLIVNTRTDKYIYKLK